VDSAPGPTAATRERAAFRAVYALDDLAKGATSAIVGCCAGRYSGASYHQLRRRRSHSANTRGSGYGPALLAGVGGPAVGNNVRGFEYHAGHCGEQASSLFSPAPASTLGGRRRLTLSLHSTRLTPEQISRSTDRHLASSAAAASLAPGAGRIQSMGRVDS
jgi:hypothetical protein